MKQSKKAGIVAVCLLAGGTQSVLAAEPVAVSAEDLLNVLIEQGVVDEKQVNDVVRKAKERTRRNYQTGVETVPAEKRDLKTPQDSSVVRVPYVPQYIKDDIRDKVRNELREEVVADVMKKAKDERWGLPGTAPDWTTRIKFFGDVRLRAESIMYGEDNLELEYLDYMKVNDAGEITGEDEYLNLTEDRERLRVRARFGLKAAVTEGVEAGIRLATGSTSNPVSTNETLGDYGNSFDVLIDRGYLKYGSFADDVMLVGGRFENPFYRTDLIWDNDLQFDGIAGSWYWLRSSNWESDEQQWDPFVTAGIFPVEEFELSTQDKWMYGAQLGFTHTAWSQNRLRAAVGYYQYDNMAGIKNAVNDDLMDETAPDFIQKGNSYFNLKNPAVPPSGAQPAMFGLAYDYTIVDLLLEYDIATFSPHHVILSAEYIENIAGDRAEAEARAGDEIAVEGFDGYLFKATFGWPIVAKPDDWQVAVGYRSLGANALVDGFADSDFHAGGTDGRGYIIEGNYGIFNETWVTLKWMSSDAIDLPELAVDILQIDLNARF
ncbi:MAG TPA: putative porin [Dongiaceae bacterium]|nr:putative porin [Dongiaceae bacterium]